MTSHSGIELAERLNADCHCVSLDSASLEAELERVSPGHPRQINLPANGSALVKLTGPDARPIDRATYKVTNFLVNVGQPLEVEFTVQQAATAPAR